MEHDICNSFISKTFCQNHKNKGGFLQGTNQMDQPTNLVGLKDCDGSLVYLKSFLI